MVYEGRGYQSIRGIDVSSHQGVIDWKRVKEDGISFAMIRCGYRGGTEGLQHVDERFEQNMEQAIAQGIDVGVYYYCSAITMDELEEDANLVLQLVKDYDLKYPIAFDMEIYDESIGRINALTVDEKTQMALAFCDRMEENGYRSMIYGNKSWLKEHLAFDQIRGHSLWYAGYVESPTLVEPFDMWQFTNQGSIDGIEGSVDLNVKIEKS